MLFFVGFISILLLIGECNSFNTLSKIFANSKKALTDFFCKWNTTKIDFSGNSFRSLYSRGIKDATFFVDEYLLKLYNDVHVMFHNLDILSGFKENNSLLNRLEGIINYSSFELVKWFHDYPCQQYNASELNFQIKHEVFGQHIVELSLIKLLNDHLSGDKPKKILLLTFQGQPGIGKSFVRNIVINNMYKEGYNSKFVHIYYGSLDFHREREKEIYRRRLREEISFSMKFCESSIFIFEDVDRMIPGVIDVILPYIYLNETMPGINFSRSIFIFISNSGYKKIYKILYDSWMDGISRETLTLQNFSSVLKEAAYIEPGGLQHSEIVNKNLIDAFVPFLPLEKTHVKDCIIHELKLRKLPFNKDVIEKITNAVTYYPPENELFSVTGCKRIASKVDLYDENNV